MSRSIAGLEWKDSPISGGPCPACESEGGTLILVVDRPKFSADAAPLRLLKCPSCRSLYYDGEDVVSGYNDADFASYYAQHYVEVGAGIEAMIRPITALGAKARGMLLDVGCGFGYVPHYWQVSGRGAAIGLEMATYGKLGRELLGVEIYADTCRNCPEIADRQFDIVYSSEVIEHVPNPLEFLEELINKLAKNGILVLTTPSADFITPERSAAELIGPLSPGYHYFLLSAQALRDLIQKAGLEHCVVEDMNGRLIAWASHSKLPPISWDVFDWDEYLDYLEKVASNGDRSVAGGALYRLFKDSLNTGRRERASPAFSRLSILAVEKYGIDLLNVDVPRATAAVTFREHLHSNPAWLGGALLFGGVLKELEGNSSELTSRMFASAVLVLQQESAVGARFAGEATAFLPYAKRQYNLALQRQFSSSKDATRRQNDLCLFAHYDSNGSVADYVVNYLKELRAAHFDIVFVTTAALTNVELEKVASYTQDVVVRENTGYDFGSWLEAYRKHKGSPTGLLLLCNDSVYGPLWKFGSSIRKLFAVEADFYGMVRSNEFKPHLQSWFLLFTPFAHQSEAFRQFMSSQTAGRSKQQIIDSHEIGLTTSLEAAGLNCHALYDSRSHKFPPRFVANPTHFLWRQLVKDYEVPFIKVELLRDNPMRLKLGPWREIIGKYNRDTVLHITSHLSGRQKNTDNRQGVLPRIYQSVVVLDNFFGQLGWRLLQRANLISWNFLARVLSKSRSLLIRILNRSWGLLIRILNKIAREIRSRVVNR